MASMASASWLPPAGDATSAPSASKPTCASASPVPGPTAAKRQPAGQGPGRARAAKQAAEGLTTMIRA